MADEIKVTFGVVITKGSLKASLPSSTSSLDLSGDLAGVIPQIVGTTEEVLSTGDVTADGGIAGIVNLDGTNYLEVGVVVAATFYPLLKIGPNERAGGWRWADISEVYVRANTAAVNIQSLVSEP